jgi:hypothetical protein
MIANLATKTYSLFLATETQENHNNRRLLVSILIDSGHSRQGRCLVLPLRLDSTVADEISKAVHYVLGFAPVPNRDLEVNLIHSYSGTVDLPTGHSKVNLDYVSSIQNPATAPLKNFIRNLAPMM